MGKDRWNLQMWEWEQNNTIMYQGRKSKKLSNIPQLTEAIIYSSGNNGISHHTGNTTEGSSSKEYVHYCVPNSTEKPQQQAPNTEQDLCPYLDKGNYITGTPQIKGEKLTCTQDGPKRKASFTILKEAKRKRWKWSEDMVDAPPVLLLRRKTSK